MTQATPTPNDGPELLDERSLGGIGVHLLALLTGFLGAGAVYALSNHEYTRANARNALNWHLSVFALTVVSVLTFFLGADEVTVGGDAVEWSLLPAPLDAVVGLVGTVLLFPTALAWLLTGVFAIVATVRAIFGTPWHYPLARDFVER